MSRTMLDASYNSDIRNEFANLIPPTFKIAGCQEAGLINYTLPGYLTYNPATAFVGQAIANNNACSNQSACAQQQQTAFSSSSCGSCSNNGSGSGMQAAGPYYSSSGAVVSASNPYNAYNPNGVGSAIDTGSANNNALLYNASSSAGTGQFGVQQVQCGSNVCGFNTAPAAKAHFAYMKTPYFDPHACSAINNYSKGTINNVLNSETWINGQGVETINAYTLPNLSQAYGSLPPIPTNTLLFTAIPKYQVPNMPAAIRTNSAISYVINANYVFNKTLVVNAHTSYYTSFLYQFSNQLFSTFVNDPTSNDVYCVWFSDSAISTKPLPGMGYMRIGSLNRITFETQYTNKIIYLNFGTLSGGSTTDDDICCSSVSVMCGLSSALFVGEHFSASGAQRQ